MRKKIELSNEKIRAAKLKEENARKVCFICQKSDHTVYCNYVSLSLSFPSFFLSGSEGIGGVNLMHTCSAIVLRFSLCEVPVMLILHCLNVVLLN